MAERLPKSVYQAINQAMTPAFGRWAQKTYGMGGKKLLAKVAAIEGGGSIDEGSSATSYAGAKGPFQFIASTRAGYIQQHKVDAWKNDLSAAKAAMIHLRGTGVKGYNPGMAAYEGMVLGAKVDTSPLRTGGKARPRKVRPKSKGNPGTDAVAAVNAGPDPAALSMLRKELLLGGDLSLDKLLAYKSQANMVPDRITPGQPAVPGDKPKRGPAPQGRTPDKRVIKNDGWKGAQSAGAFVKLGKILKNTGNTATGKRPTQMTASGNVSDHYQGNMDSYAWDISGGDMDKAARVIARKLGLKTHKGVQNVTKTINGRKFRFQLLWQTDDHYDHVHLGVDREDIPG